MKWTHLRFFLVFFFFCWFTILSLVGFHLHYFDNFNISNVADAKHEAFTETATIKPGEGQKNIVEAAPEMNQAQNQRLIYRDSKINAIHPFLKDSPNLRVACIQRIDEKCVAVDCKTREPSPDISFRGAVLRAEGFRDAMPIAASMFCGLSRKFKFVFVHVLKNGGSEIRGLLKKGLCGSLNCNNKEIYERVHCRNALKSHPDFFIWTFVREPRERISSAFKMGQRARPDKGSDGPSFQEFILHPNRRWTSVAADHWKPETNFIFDHHDCPVYDYAGTLEEFRTSMLPILQYVSSQAMQDAFDAYEWNLKPHNDLFLDDAGLAKFMNSYRADYRLLSFPVPE